MIFVAFIIVALVVIYAILYQVVIEQRYITSESHEQSIFFRFGRKSGWLPGATDGDLERDRCGNFGSNLLPVNSR